MQEIETKQRPALLGSFKEHPESVGETYFGHMRFATKFSAKLFIAAGAALVHAIFPFLFEDTASKQIKSMCRLIENRSGPDS